MDDCPLTNEQLAGQLRETFPRLPNSPITDAQRQLIHIACDRLTQKPPRLAYDTTATSVTYLG